MFVSNVFKSYQRKMNSTKYVGTFYTLYQIHVFCNIRYYATSTNLIVY